MLMSFFLHLCSLPLAIHRKIRGWFFLPLPGRCLTKTTSSESSPELILDTPECVWFANQIMCTTDMRLQCMTLSTMCTLDIFHVKRKASSLQRKTVPSITATSRSGVKKNCTSPNSLIRLPESVHDRHCGLLS